MNYNFAAPSLTKPTFETLESYSKKMFKKVERFIEANSDNPTIRIAVERDGEEFDVTVEVHSFEDTIVKAKNRDLRRAIEKASHELKAKYLKDKDRKLDLSRVKDAIWNLKNKIGRNA